VPAAGAGVSNSTVGGVTDADREQGHDDAATAAISSMNTPVLN
jgi:hypothetical protein